MSPDLPLAHTLDGALCSGRDPLQVEASSGSSLQHEDEVKQLLLFLFPSGFPLPSRARDRKLTALHSRL